MALLPAQKRGIVLLFNACHFWMNPAQAQFGSAAVALLAGQPAAPGLFLRLVPSMLRAQLLIPILQALDVAVTLGDWRRPATVTGAGHRRGGLCLLSLAGNGLIALALRPALGRNGPFLRLFMPDTWWLATMGGSFALAWSVLRGALILLHRRGAAKPRRTPVQLP
jgi:hypothetical protein